MDIRSTPILGLEGCVKLNLIKKVEKIDSIEFKNNLSKEEFIRLNKDVFEGVGKFDKKFEIKVKEGVLPVVKSGRILPQMIKDKLKDTLIQLESKKIIGKVDYPTDWVHNITIVEKPGGSLRICLDPLELNKAIQKEHYPIPTSDEIIPNFTGKKWFSVLDLKDGFWDMELTDKSSDLCTFQTPFGRWRFKRFPFGLASDPEIFQNNNEETFKGISNVQIYFDDLVIYAENELAHDKTLQLVIERAREKNVKFNINTFQYKVHEFKFLGMIFPEKGMTLDKEQVKSIIELKNPKSKKNYFQY